MRAPSPSAPAAWSGDRPRAPPGAFAARVNTPGTPLDDGSLRDVFEDRGSLVRSHRAWPGERSCQPECWRQLNRELRRQAARRLRPFTELQHCGLGGGQSSLGIHPAVIARWGAVPPAGTGAHATARSTDEGLRAAAATRQGGASRCLAGPMEILKPEEARGLPVIDTRRRTAISLAQALALSSPDRAPPTTKPHKPLGPSARKRPQRLRGGWPLPRCRA